jgi:hypothetical protein
MHLRGAAGLAAALLLAPAAWSADDAAPSTVRKTAQGLHFNVPPDWPIEERGGVVGPVPIEEYLAQKFRAMEGRLSMIDQQLAGFDLRLRVVEEQMKESSKGMRSTERSGQP